MYLDSFYFLRWRWIIFIIRNRISETKSHLFSGHWPNGICEEGELPVSALRIKRWRFCKGWQWAVTELGTSPRRLPAECGMFSLAETRRHLDISLAPFFGVEFWRLGALIGSNYCPERTGLLLMNTHKHAHTQTQAHMCTHTHMNTQIYTYTRTQARTQKTKTHIHTYTYIYTYIHTHMCTHTHEHTDIHIYKDTSTHTKDKNTYTHIYTHIHIHTYTQAHKLDH